MHTVDSQNYEKLRANFQGRKALYIEKGALLVRVNNIRADLAARCINAEVEEVPTSGLGAGSFRLVNQPSDAESLRWQIGAGFLTQFSDNHWVMGYGGWSMYFAPQVVQGVAELAASWPQDLDAFERYERVLDWLLTHDDGGAMITVFSGRSRPLWGFLKKFAKGWRYKR